MTFAACIASSIILSVHRNIVHRNNEILICLCTGTKDKNPCLCTGTKGGKNLVCAQEHYKSFCLCMRAQKHIGLSVHRNTKSPLHG